MKIAVAFLSVLVLLLAGALFHFKSELNEQSGHLKDVSSEKYALETELIDIRTKKDALAATLSEQKIELDKLSGELDAARQTIEASQTRLSGSQETIEKLTQEKLDALRKVEETHAQLAAKLSEEIGKQDITVQESGGKLKLSLNNQILFPSGMTTLSDEGLQILDKIGSILQGVKGKVIRVEGHTDNVKIRARAQDRFPTNWELSAFRATHVVRYFIEHSHIPADRIYAVGKSEYHPVADNTTDEGRSKNRRIEIMLESYIPVKEVKEMQLVDLKTGEPIDPNAVRATLVAPADPDFVAGPEPELALPTVSETTESEMKDVEVESGFANLQAPDSFTDGTSKSGVGYIWVRRPSRSDELNQ